MAGCSSSLHLVSSNVFVGKIAGNQKSFKKKFFLDYNQTCIGGVTKASNQDRGVLATKASYEDKQSQSACRNEGPGNRMVSLTKRQLLLAGTALISASCPICSGPNAIADQWDYGTLTGPQEWSNICVDGTTQSPIDLPTSATNLLEIDPLGSIEFDYKGANPSFFNTGHGTMQVNYEEALNQIKIGDRKFVLKQFHFHAPSEHSFAGKKAAMEVHLVHADEKGQLAVVGVMMEATAFAPRNLCLQAALDFAPEEKRATVPTPVECLQDDTPKAPNEPDLCFSLEINPAALLPKPSPPDGRRPYFHYNGSLTTPPCLENVEWFMLDKPIYVPGEQVLEFMTYVGEGQTLAMNSRPVQKIGDRVIKYGA